ncbi:alanine racemase [Candidatus Daviesbacteria bacterium RIFCSPLOWO2_02_FULL_38_18]|uniref:Alanine racemase n=1 Tax=Candidatus Daviesbacteria bacterium GW2011_GWF2_38_6 TaxID=1618432 RepID=A0A0G0MRE3_9BACT|nr:MAG: Alanine racemase [Candidatus Daviesbacteria bacterium GW2011_GWF2_38_6]OGE68215.1 MAG: alanine racemase [Candidatus Daviesbacteria bacterium RIFCSPLOWO2_02_FULL_38_18]OGE73092.1 MAG: alanine racemase [Candidatus Daviesbacteria bacterium RIFCSPLOWO2_12_FULL_38_10]
MYKTLNRIEISRKNLLENYRFLSAINRKIKIAPVLKSNGYGHGIIEVAQILDKVGAPFFCVDSLYEAYELYKAKIKTPVLIMGYTNPENLKIKKLLFSFAVFDLQTVEILNKYQPGCAVHIFVDTGMSREGVTLEDLPDFLKTLKKLNVKVDGLMSHLAGGMDKLQIQRFHQAQKLVQKYGFSPKWIHLGTSGNMARVGLKLYLQKPILKFISHLAQVKKIKKSERVGYDRTYKAKKDTIIGIIPAGYYDGVNRGLSNKGFVKIKNIFCPIIGRVSMNMTTVDLSKTYAKIGDEVIIYSDNPQNKNSVENAAKICKKIPYEILVNLAESTKRIIV